MRWRLAVVAFAAMLSSYPFAQAPPTLTLLDQYSKGQFAQIESTLAVLENFRRLYKDLRHDDVKQWLDVGGPADRSRREPAAATFALEAARADEWYEWKWIQRQTTLGQPAGMNGPQGAGASMSKHPVLYWMPPPLLIEWGCELMRQSLEPRPIERVWQLAAMATAQRSEDVQFLIGFTTIDVVDPSTVLLPEPTPASTPTTTSHLPNLPNVFVTTRGGDPGPLEVVNRSAEIGHLNHVAERFPDEKRFALAEALMRERPSPSEAIKLYTSLVNDPNVGGEAAARLGALYLRRGAIANALQMFAKAETLTRDPDVIYLARFYRGQALLRTGKTDDAVEAFRAALAARPGSQSASAALAVILAKREQRTEAQAVMKAVLDAGADFHDPHLEYVHGDDRFWPVLIARLRKEIAK